MSWIPRGESEPKIRVPEPDGQEHPLMAGSVGRDRQLGGITSPDDMFRATSPAGSTVKARPKAVLLVNGLLVRKRTLAAM